MPRSPCWANCSRPRRPSVRFARFPAYRDLASFDFAHSEVNEALVRQLHRCEFLEQAHNVVLVGGPDHAT